MPEDPGDSPAPWRGRPKAAIVLQALLAGMHVPMERNTWALTEDGRPAVRMIRTARDDGASEEVWLSGVGVGDLPLQAFIRMAESLPDHEVTLLAAELALERRADGINARRDRRLAERNRRR